MGHLSRSSSSDVSNHSLGLRRVDCSTQHERSLTGGDTARRNGPVFSLYPVASAIALNEPPHRVRDVLE